MQDIFQKFLWSLPYFFDIMLAKNPGACLRCCFGMEVIMSKLIWKPGNMLYPVPAVMVSCGHYHSPGDETGCNIITVAWTGTVCSDPAMTYVSIRPSRHSHAIIKETGEFVINLTTASLASVADACGVLSGRDVHKFERYPITAQRAATVDAPLIAESPVNLECKVTQQLPLGSHDMFLAHITAVRVDESLLDSSGRLHLDRAHLVAYSHGMYYELGKALGRFGFSVRKKAPVSPRPQVRPRIAKGGKRI